MMKKNWTKRDLIVILMIVLMNFFQGQFYYLAKISPFPATLLSNPMDDMIPFSPIFVLPYVLWHILLFVFPFYLYKRDEKSFYIYFVLNILSDLCCFTIFFFFPTWMIRPTFEVTGPITWLLELVYLGDTPPVNCFPSLHCTTSFLFIYVLLHDSKLSKKKRYVWSGVFATIVLSTLLVKQHVLLDVFGAFFQTILLYGLFSQGKWPESLKRFVYRHS